MKVEIEPGPGDEWDRFAEGTSGARLGHASGWAHVLRDAYGLRPHYLVARDDAGVTQGVLPLVWFRTLRMRRELVSLPFHDSAGVLARTEAAREALIEAALAAARSGGAAVLELRHADALPCLPVARPSPRVNLALALESDPDAQWKAFRAKVRNQVRKAEKEGLRLLSAPVGSEGPLDGFYEPFLLNMRDIGTPPHSRRFYAIAGARFGSRLRFIVTEREGRAVGGLVAIRFGDRVTVTWASTLRSERARCPNNQIYWEAIRWAVEQGAGIFDLGRSPREAGTYRFKVGWGAVATDLAWSQLDPETGRLVEAPAGEDPLRRLSAAWQRLPVRVTR